MTWSNVSEVTTILGSSTINVDGTVTPIVSLANTTVTASTYSYPTIAIDAQGRITSASSNTPVLSVSGTAANISSTGGQNPVLNLINTAVTPATYNFATLTVDAKGRLTAASTGIPVTSVATGTGLSGGTITSTGTISLANTVVTVGTYNFATLTVDQQGRLTSASTGVPVTSVTLSGSTGLTIGGTNPITSTGTISLTLGTELQALSGLSATGLVTRTAANTYAERTITPTSSTRITVNNGDGVAANPTIDLSTILTACYAATTANLANTTYNNGTAGNGATITYTGGVFAPFGTDSVSPSLNARVLVKNQSSAFQNGIYTLTTIGSTSPAVGYVLTRATDYDMPIEISPANIVTVTNGNTLANTSWNQTASVTTIGTDSISFTQSTTAAVTPSNITTDAYGRVTNIVARGIAFLTAYASCFAATTALLSATYNNGASGIGATLTNNSTQAVFSVDGQSPVLNSRILVKDQTSTFQNGIYTVTNLGSISTNWVLTRATDFDTPAEIIVFNQCINVTNGSLNANTTWIETATVTAIGTGNPIQFASASWTPPTGVTSIKVTVIGGGGGSTTNAGGGGGAGGTAIAYFSTLPASLAYTVGAGGASGAAGSNSTFSATTTLMTANGGAVGSGGTGAIGGAGGTATLGGGITNGLAISGGGGGGNAIANTLGTPTTSGCGGNSSLGGGGRGGITGTPGGSGATNTGGGAGGQGNGATGNVGGSGVIIIEY